MGTRTVLGIVAHDNKGRFNIAGHVDDPRKEYVETEIWPTWICASHHRCRYRHCVVQLQHSRGARGFSRQRRQAILSPRRVPTEAVPSHDPRCCVLAVQQHEGDHGCHGAKMVYPQRNLSRRLVFNPKPGDPAI